MPATTVTASFSSSLFMEQRSPITVPLQRSSMGAARGPHTVLPLWDRHRGQRRDTADIRCARELGQTPSWDDGLVTLGRCRNTGRGDRALTGKGIDVLVENTGDGRVSRVETVRLELQSKHEQVFLRVRQAEVADRHVDVVRDLGHRPAVHLFHRSRRAVSRRDLEPKHVPRIVEMDELLQALGVAIVKELLLEVRYRMPVRVDLA